MEKNKRNTTKKLLITRNKGKKKIIKVSMINYHAACLSKFYFLVTQIISGIYLWMWIKK